MKPIKLNIKKMYNKSTKYTPEEKYSIFVEGKLRVPEPKKSGKIYTRKEKYKTY